MVGLILYLYVVTLLFQSPSSPIDPPMEPRTAAAAALTGDFEPFAKKSKTEMAAAFEPASSVTMEDWVGTYVDIFSPDLDTKEQLPWDANEKSRRFVNYLEETNELVMSADMGDGSTWGKRFDPSTPASPVFSPLSKDDNTIKMIDFVVLVPADNVKYEEAKKGALQFKVCIGKAFGKDCMKWSGPYQGKGGPLAGFDLGPE